MTRHQNNHQNYYRRPKPKPTNRYHDRGQYYDYKRNVPTKPVGLADWVFLSMFVAIAIGFLIYVL